MSQDNDERAKLREGDSWRARTFRRKDELLNFGYDKLTEFLAKKELPKFHDGLAEIHRNLNELRENPDSEELGTRTIAKLEEISALLKEAGFDSTAPVAEVKPEDPTDPSISEKL